MINILNSLIIVKVTCNEFFYCKLIIKFIVRTIIAIKNTIFSYDSYYYILNIVYFSSISGFENLSENLLRTLLELIFEFIFLYYLLILFSFVKK